MEKVISLLSSNFNVDYQTSDFDPQTQPPDILVIKPSPEDSIGIDKVREVIKFCSFKPYYSGYKTVVVVNAQALTIEAQNALLKTLEEPPAQTLIFLLCPNSQSLLPTVLSRCQIIDLPGEQSPDSKDLDSIKLTLEAIVAEPLGKAIQVATLATPDREQALNLCRSLVYLLHTRLKGVSNTTFETVSNLSPQTTVRLVRILQKTTSYLDANTNVRLAIDDMVVSMQKVTSVG